MATLDCDGGGVDNQTECNEGEDPLDPADDCDALDATGADLCTYINANPMSIMATADCDGGGIDNVTECAAGGDPNDPADDVPPCTSPICIVSNGNANNATAGQAMDGSAAPFVVPSNCPLLDDTEALNNRGTLVALSLIHI